MANSWAAVDHYIDQTVFTQEDRAYYKLWAREVRARMPGPIALTIWPTHIDREHGHNTYLIALSNPDLARPPE